MKALQATEQHHHTNQTLMGQPGDFMLPLATLNEVLVQMERRSAPCGNPAVGSSDDCLSGFKQFLRTPVQCPLCYNDDYLLDHPIFP